jgi:hypothetical protein
MDCNHMLRSCVVPLALVLLTGAARAQAPEDPAAVPDLSADAPLDLSTPEPDDTRAKGIDPLAGQPSLSDWSSRMGVDYRKPSIPGADFQPGALTAGAVPDQSTGVAWATVTAPGFDFPLGWDSASIETRLDPSQEQGELGTTLSRSVPVGENLTVTLQNGVSLTARSPHAGAQPGLGQQPGAALQRPADRYQPVRWARYFEHGRQVAAHAERGAEAVRRTVERDRLGEQSAASEISGLSAGFKRQW